MSTSGVNSTGETLDDRTLEELPLESASTPEPAAPVELVQGPAPDLADDTQHILLQRLRVGTLILLGGFIFFTIRSIVPVTDRNLVAIGESNFIVNSRVAVTVVLAVCAAYLWSPIKLSLFTLRIVELGVFGSSIGLCAFIQQRLLDQAAAADHPAIAQTVMASSVIMWFALVLIYGVFIPNSWWRAAVILGIMTAIPFVMTLVASLRDHAFGLMVLKDSLLPVSGVMLVGYATALYSSYAMGQLRREAFVARQYGQYRLGRQLGTGGMGEVYLAEHQMLKRPCAIKVIRPSRATDVRALARFEREVRATAQLSHWNVVDIYDYGRTDDGTFFYVMEYLPGLSLQQIVEQQGAVQPERAVHLLRQVCQGLAEAHRQGLIHRDIKPSNIIATARGGRHDVAKLLDFGLAATAVELQTAGQHSSGQVAGSPLYLAPEVIAGAPPGVRSDLFSLGGVAYFLLAGRPPVRGTEPVEIMRAQVEQQVPPLRSINSAVPADLEAVVLKLLDKNPTERIGDAGAVERALAACACADRWTPELAARWWVPCAVPERHDPNVQSTISTL